jgi:hypothetical protein
MSNKKIHRCLKRYLIRELSPFILADLLVTTVATSILKFAVAIAWRCEMTSSNGKKRSVALSSQPIGALLDMAEPCGLSLCAEFQYGPHRPACITVQLARWTSRKPSSPSSPAGRQLFCFNTSSSPLPICRYALRGRGSACTASTMTGPYLEMSAGGSKPWKFQYRHLSGRESRISFEERVEDRRPPYLHAQRL